jgi:hypothetical protein
VSADNLDDKIRRPVNLDKFFFIICHRDEPRAALIQRLVRNEQDIGLDRESRCIVAQPRTVHQEQSGALSFNAVA